MSAPPNYTEFHPRWYRRRISTYWWMGRRAYLLFILRELSSAFIAWSVVLLLWMVWSVSQEGHEAYDGFLAACRHPLLIGLNVISLAFAVLHAVTWFQLAPQAMVVHFRGKRVPGMWIMAANFAAWAVVSAVVAWLVLRE